MAELRFKDEFEKEKLTNPMAGVEYGSKDIYMDLVTQSHGEDGKIRIQDLIVIMAGLAGYSCQAAALNTVVFKDKRMLGDAFRVVVTPSGSKYVFGEAINEYLYGTNHSVWNLAACMLKAMSPDTDLPDMKVLVTAIAKNIGYSDVKVVKQYTTDELIAKLAPAWELIYDKLKGYCPNPDEWPVLFGLMLQKGMAMTQGVLEPQVAIGFVMEVAAFSSKLDIVGRLA